MSFETLNNIVGRDRYDRICRESTQESGEREDHIVQVVLQGGAIQAKRDWEDDKSW